MRLNPSRDQRGTIYAQLNAMKPLGGVDFARAENVPQEQNIWTTRFEYWMNLRGPAALIADYGQCSIIG